MSRTDTEMSGLQKPKLENLCMSVKASTMHASMCFAKADTMQWELVDGKLCDYESPNI